MRHAIVFLLGLVIAGPGAAAIPTIRVGNIDSEKTCSLYEMTSGRHREAAAIDNYGAAYSAETSWRTYLVRDCIDHFASLRSSLQAALASSGKLAVVPGAAAAAYVVEGHISEVSGGEPAAPLQQPTRGGVHISSNRMFVNMSVTLRDRSGRIVYGGLLTKAIETGFNMETRAMSTMSRESGQAVYSELEHQVALAVARLVAFDIVPLRVTNSSSNRIELNYGAPLLALGTIVQVTASNGAIVRYNVTGSTPGGAEADYYGGAEARQVALGDRASMIESDDPAANARRFDKVDLP